MAPRVLLSCAFAPCRSEWAPSSILCDEQQQQTPSLGQPPRSPWLLPLTKFVWLSIPSLCITQGLVYMHYIDKNCLLWTPYEAQRLGQVRFGFGSSRTVMQSYFHQNSHRHACILCVHPIGHLSKYESQSNQDSYKCQTPIDLVRKPRVTPTAKLYFYP